MIRAATALALAGIMRRRRPEAAQFSSSELSRSRGFRFPDATEPILEHCSERRLHLMRPRYDWRRAWYSAASNCETGPACETRDSYLHTRFVEARIPFRRRLFRR